mmetsp:Transcript_24842/g.58683  ORF Transcript_24842/g.58683 Transcript_24842/m.58683 type:complete len:311 (-) Transcript_24842:47-979(-)
MTSEASATTIGTAEGPITDDSRKLDCAKLEVQVEMRSPEETTGKRDSPESRASTPPTVRRPSPDEVKAQRSVVEPLAKKPRTSDELFLISVPPGLDQHSFQVLLRMTNTVTNVTGWVRPGEVLGGLAPQVSTEPPPVSQTLNIGPVPPPAPTGTVPAEPVGPLVPATTQQPSPASRIQPLTPLNSSGARPSTPRGPKSVNSAGSSALQRVVPSTRCSRCAQKKKKCVRVVGGACMGCQKWAKNAKNPEEMHHRLESCKIPMVYNQRGNSLNSSLHPPASPATITSAFISPSADQTLSFSQLLGDSALLFE